MPHTAQQHALPVEGVLDALSVALRDAGTAVLCAPPGSGKTTRIPLALMEAAWLAGQRIVMLEPRRVAARAAARWMAGLLGEPVGQRVGFRVRFEAAVSARTRVEVVTEGLLARRLQHDPELQGVGLVIFDEFHERNLDADLALALTLDARRGLREDLRVLVMSATLDAQPVARLLGGAPVLHVQGRAHPITVRYQERPGAALAASVCTAVRSVLADSAGDVLVFLPGVREIRAAQEQLAHHRDTRQLLICPLYGDLPADAQDRAILADPHGRRRVVLATDIAQTSLTIEGVHAVVDSGLARRPLFDPNTGLSRLRTVPISKASAEQRAGRAGRLGPGLALRLWTEAEHARRGAHDGAEILQADLAALALELARWGVAGAHALDWLDAPPAAALEQARDLLATLGAVDALGRITALGQAMAAIPAHPRLACMLARADSGADRALAADIAAVLDGADLLRAEQAREAGCDLRPRLEILAQRGANPRGGAQAVRGVARARRIAAQLLHAGGSEHAAAPSDLQHAGRLLLCGFPDRLAQRRASARGRFLLAGGRGLRLDEHDPLAGSDWLVVPDLEAGAVEARAFRAAALGESDVRAVLGDRLQWIRRVGWNEREQAVEAVEEERFGALVLRTRGPPRVDAQERIDAMLDGVRRLGLDALPWDLATRQFSARVESLRHWQPDAGWPAMHDAALLAELDAWLGPFLIGITRREHLARLGLAAALRARVPPALAARLDADAPTHLAVPGGSRVALEYRPGAAPILAVKLQEMFGAIATPTVCQGQVPVLLHLLSPARRPLHVTQDLPSFWRNAYPQVRKQMRGRYPKHPWPEDPLTAAPTPHTKHRR